jgi:NAD+ kinase
LNIGLYANSSLPGARAVAAGVYRLLGGKVELEMDTARSLRRSGRKLEDLKADVLIVVGGDGTMLKSLMKFDGPVLGINAGDVGFLTEVGKGEVRKAINRLKAGNYRVEEKLKLKTVVDGVRFRDAVNEAVVTGADPGKVRHFNLEIDGSRVGMVKSDGIIISTPTGSTSYSLAAGGPIVDPSASVLVVSPIAPYGISSRPIVTGERSTIRLSVEGARRCVLVIDGQTKHPLSGEERIDFSVSDRKAKFISFDHDFYHRIHTKLTG